jgi:Tfp pilus assembly protein PilO
MTRRYAVAAVAGVAVVLLFFVFFLKPKLSQITDVRDQVQQAQDQTDSLRIQLARLKQAQREQPQTQARLAIFDRLLPSTPDLPALIRQLQSAASASGMDLVSIAPSPPSNLTGGTGIQAISVNIQINGGFFRLETFLTRIEDLQRAIEVTSMSIAATTDEATGLQTLSTTLTFRMYVVQANARVGGGTSTTPQPAASPTP